MLRTAPIFAALLALAPLSSANAQTDIAEVYLEKLAPLVPAELRTEAEGLLANAGGDNPAAFWGDALFLQRHLEPAAWFYGQDLQGRSDSPEAMNNFGATLLEIGLSSDPQDSAMLKAAATLFRKAMAADPAVAAYPNNLGYALLRIAGPGGNQAMLEEAAGLLRQAIALEDDEALYWSHLAEVLAALGDMTGAADALAEAHKIDSADPSMLMAQHSLPPDVAAAGPNRDYCDAVNFNCAQICPGGIIGGLNQVTCEMESSSAQMACREGQPYPTSYNCDIEMPAFGIMIPGLYPGFSILSPWGSLHVIVQGDGRVDFKFDVKAGLVPGLSGYVGVTGSYNPSSGVAIYDTRGGVSTNLWNRDGLISEMNRFGVGPASVRVRGDGSGVSTEFRTGGASVIKL